MTSDAPDADGSQSPARDAAESDVSTSPAPGSAATAEHDLRQQAGGDTGDVTPVSAATAEPDPRQQAGDDVVVEPAPHQSATAAAPPAATDAGAVDEAPWRFWPRTKVAQAVLVTAALAVVGYTVLVLCVRYRDMLDPWGYDGDQPQAVFHYWRYRIAGAFPPGDFHTDYAFVMHAPPAWWVMMASLSTFISPLIAAKLLNIVAVAAACAFVFIAASVRANAFIGLAAIALLMRDQHFTELVAGGYARSFGPALTYAFLAAFIARKHYLCLVVLVVQAALYPSTVMACGLAYGLYTVLAGPMRERLRRMAGMFVTGLLILTLGKFQDLAAPKWWGPVMSYAEAEKMPAWRAGGRSAEVPLRPIMSEVAANAQVAFRGAGHVLVRAGRVLHEPRNATFAVAALVAACGVSFVVQRLRRRRFFDAFPWQIPLTFAAAFVAYLIARHEAFKFYLPYRPLQHVWPYAIDLALPLAMWTLVRNALPRKRMAATAAAFALAVVPVFVLFGDATDKGPKTYMSAAPRAQVLEHLRTLPLHAIIAGEFTFLDRTPLLTWHRSYVMRNLAHPFRAGYYAEAERRIIANYSALYATNIDDVLAFMKKEKVDYIIYRPGALNTFDTQIFNGPRAPLEKLFRANKPKGFALEHPPESAIAYRNKDVLLIEVNKLAAALAAGDRGGPPPPAPFGPQPEFIGPLPSP